MAIGASDAVVALSALAQEHRLAVFRLLVQAGSDGRAAGALAETLALPGSSLSFHLAHLTRVGLIQHQRRGRTLIYTADYDAMNRLIGYLMENCCGRSGLEAVAICTPDSEAGLPIGTVKVS